MPVSRSGEYAERGDYHRRLSPDWEYYPTYLAKLERVRAHLSALPARARVLDAGCGEGVLVDEFHERLAIEGLDPNYSSDRVRRGSLTALPYPNAAFDHALCLDVLEHLAYDDQARALAELFRVVKPGGSLLVTVPNLAHLQSRVHFALAGRLIRTASPAKHPGDRPIGEYLDLARRAGFQLVERRGIFPTVPVLTRAIRRSPARLAPLHRLLTRLLPIPGWCFLNVLRFLRP
jgi:SAM-dependent methyltransferase